MSLAKTHERTAVTVENAHIQKLEFLDRASQARFPRAADLSQNLLCHLKDRSPSTSLEREKYAQFPHSRPRELEMFERSHCVILDLPIDLISSPNSRLIFQTLAPAHNLVEAVCRLAQWSFEQNQGFVSKSQSL